MVSTSLDPPQGPAGPDLSGRRAGRRSTRRIALLGVALAALAGTIAAREHLATLAVDFLEAYVEAQQAMLAASGNLTASGEAEFAVLLAEGTDATSFRESLAARDDVRYARAADLPGWVIVHTPAGNRAGLDAVLAMPEVRVVMPNRGLWICH